MQWGAIVIFPERTTEIWATEVHPCLISCPLVHFLKWTWEVEVRHVFFFFFFLDCNCLETFTSADGVHIIIKDFSGARLPDQIFVFLWTQRVYQVNPGKLIMFFWGGGFFVNVQNLNIDTKFPSYWLWHPCVYYIVSLHERLGKLW